MNSFNKMFIVVISLLISLFAIYALFLWFGQAKLIFVPSTEIVATPGDINLKYEDIQLEHSPGEVVTGWYIPALKNDNSNTRTILFIHGNAGNISSRISTIEFIHKLGFNLFIFDYRGYGLSKGKLSELGIYADTKLAYNWLRDKKHVKPEDLFLFGRSLGGAVAIDLATKVEAAGLIIEASFTSAADMGVQMFPIMPVRSLIRFDFNSEERIKRVTMPLFIAHSPDDDMIPYQMGQRLFKAATTADKRFIDLKGQHNDLSYYNSELYLNSLHEFLGIN